MGTQRQSVAFAGGVTAAFAARALLVRGLTAKLRRDVRRLNEGDYEPLLASYAADGVLVFPDRWAGEHRGRAAIETFLRNFVAAGIKGELRELYVAGPPWRLTLAARLDDHADDTDGTRVYGNRVVLVVRTRWGRIVHHEDFFVDTGRIDDFERRLQADGVLPPV